jgi:hypothetical protein
MKRLVLGAVLVLAVVGGVVAQKPPATTEVPYAKATLPATLEIIRSVRREVYVVAPSLRNAEVARTLRLRAESGITLRLLIANKAGYTGYERDLAHTTNVDARWLPERVGGAMLVVDDRAMVMGSVVSGLSSSGESIAVTRAELVPAMSAPIKQLFARARRLR